MVNIEKLPEGVTCSVHLYDAQLRHLAQHTVKISALQGQLWCDNFQSIGRVKGEDAFVAIVGFSSIAEDATRYTTAVLLRLKEENGKITVTQDDGCLGNPNRYKDIASARKALSECGNRGSK